MTETKAASTDSVMQFAAATAVHLATAEADMRWRSEFRSEDAQVLASALVREFPDELTATSLTELTCTWNVATPYKHDMKAEKFDLMFLKPRRVEKLTIAFDTIKEKRVIGSHSHVVCVVLRPFEYTTTRVRVTVTTTGFPPIKAFSFADVRAQLQTLRGLCDIPTPPAMPKELKELPDPFDVNAWISMCHKAVSGLTESPFMPSLIRGAFVNGNRIVVMIPTKFRQIGDILVVSPIDGDEQALVMSSDTEWTDPNPAKVTSKTETKTTTPVVDGGQEIPVLVEEFPAGFFGVHHHESAIDAAAAARDTKWSFAHPNELAKQLAVAAAQVRAQVTVTFKYSITGSAEYITTFARDKVSGRRISVLNKDDDKLRRAEAMQSRNKLCAMAARVLEAVTVDGSFDSASVFMHALASRFPRHYYAAGNALLCRHTVFPMLTWAHRMDVSEIVLAVDADGTCALEWQPAAVGSKVQRKTFKTLDEACAIVDRAIL